MSAWKPPSVAEEPSLVLTQWSVREVTEPDGTVGRHLVGFHIAHSSGRVSSPILDWSAETATFTTRSGRRYKIHGAPGWGTDGEYVWSVWLARWGKPLEVRDVTVEYEV